MPRVRGSEKGENQRCEIERQSLQDCPQLKSSCSDNYLLLVSRHQNTPPCKPNVSISEACSGFVLAPFKGGMQFTVKYKCGGPWMSELLQLLRTAWKFLYASATFLLGGDTALCLRNPITCSVIHLAQTLLLFLKK